MCTYLFCREINNTEVSKTTNKPTEFSHPKPKIKNVKRNSSLIVTDNFTNNDGQSILSTFTCCINGFEVRGFKDNGSQPNLIDENLVNKFNLITVEENIDLTINGINTPKTYITKKVEVPLQIGN